MQKSDFYVSRDGDNIELKATTQGDDPATGKKTLVSTKIPLVRSDAALIAEMLKDPEQNTLKLLSGGTIDVYQCTEDSNYHVLGFHDISAEHQDVKVYCEHGSDLTKLIDDLKEASLAM